MFRQINAARKNAVASAVNRLLDCAEHKLERMEQRKHDEEIAISKAKIGPYKPASIPVRVVA